MPIAAKQNEFGISIRKTIPPIFLLTIIKYYCKLSERGVVNL